MLIRFTLAMENPLIGGECSESITITWEEELSHEGVMEYSQKWIRSQPDFLISRIPGLKKVGESSLTAEPIEVENDE